VADHPLRPATDRRLGEPLPHQLANPTSATPAARGPYESPAFLLRAYAVLIRLSPSYPPLQDMFRCITHPFATRRQGCPRVTVRLACVKHAASVQSEPGSNSSVQSITSCQSPSRNQPLTQSNLQRNYLRVSTSILSKLLHRTGVNSIPFRTQSTRR
jgi:hypothetical protein